MEKIKEMSIDLETYSDVDIKKSSVYKYAESENFEILLFAVSINGSDVIVYDLACGDVLPDEILDATVSNDIINWAFNASFERICLSYWMKRNYPDRFCSYNIPEDTVGNYLDHASWRCTMIWSAYMGLPLSLEGIGAVLGLKDQEMKEAKISSATSAFHANLPNPMVAGPETFPCIHRRNGLFSSHTTNVTLKSKWASKANSISFPYQTSYGMHITLTRKSMIEVFLWIFKW